MKRKTKPSFVVLHIRVSEEIANCLDRIAEHLVLRSPGLLPKRYFGSRAAILRGIESYEAEIAATPKKRGRRG